MLNFENFISNFLQKGDDPGKFRQLDDIMFINGYPGYLHLLSVAEKSMQVVCEVKGGHIVYKIRKKKKKKKSSMSRIYSHFCYLVLSPAEVGSSKFFRLDDSKVLAWLYHKVRVRSLH